MFYVNTHKPQMFEADSSILNGMKSTIDYEILVQINKQNSVHCIIPEHKRICLRQLLFIPTCKTILLFHKQNNLTPWKAFSKLYD